MGIQIRYNFIFSEMKLYVSIDKKMGKWLTKKLKIDNL